MDGLYCGGSWSTYCEWLLVSMIMVVFCYRILSQVMVVILLAAFEQVFSFQLQPSARHNWMIFKFPSTAAFAQVRALHGHQFSRHYCITCKYPFQANRLHGSRCHPHPFSIHHWMPFEASLVQFPDSTHIYFDSSI
jgi:hypothetical protein